MLNKKLLFISLFLFATTCLVAEVPYMYDENGHLHFNYKAEELSPRESIAREDLEKDLSSIVNIPAQNSQILVH